MKKNIKVMSREKFDIYCDELGWKDTSYIPDNYTIIEIIDSSLNGINSIERFNPPVHLKNCNVAVYTFDDTEVEGNGMIRLEETIAQYIKNFIKERFEKTDKFIIHCAAGISRSGAVGEYIYRICQSQEIDVKFKEKQYIRPNQHVLSLLCKSLYGYE